ncbi:MAG: sensor histidine kinase [Chthoniobacterales bacterium]
MEPLSVAAPTSDLFDDESPRARPPFAPLREFIVAFLGVAGLTIACWLVRPFTGYGAISLIFLLGVLLAGIVFHRGPVLLVAALSALSWNFLFIPPLFTLHIAKFEDVLTFATYFIIAITVGGLTSQLKAREHLAAQVELARESERLRKTLLDCVSHELKTPLAAIGAASQELVRAAPNVQNPEALQLLATEIHHGSRRLNRVVNNLLDMNRLESGVVRPRQEWCDVRELLESAIEIERETLAGRQVRLDVPDDVPLALLDHALIEQAVAKLIANAINHADARSPIEVDAEYRENQLAISVSDRGPGIPADTAARIFEKFYRGDGHKTGGLGLGLSIARGFVESHGGTLVTENRDGGGARFIMTLPVRVTDPDQLDATV